jgi:hypothetical protein
MSLSPRPHLALAAPLLASIKERANGQPLLLLLVTLPKELLLEPAQPQEVHGQVSAGVAQVGALDDHLKRDESLCVSLWR